MSNKRFGYTLVELEFAIVILGIIATFAIVGVSQYKQKANYTKVVTDMTAIVDAAVAYKEDLGRWPQDQNEGVPGKSWEDIGLSTYLPEKPVPPCKPTWVAGTPGGWRYDWENWVPQAQNIIRVSLWLDNPPEGTKTNYYDTVRFICIDKGTSANCKVNGETNALDLRDPNTPKIISCKETGTPD